jgi:hypothetical protein
MRGTLLAMAPARKNPGGADGERLIAKLDEDEDPKDFLADPSRNRKGVFE